MITNNTFLDCLISDIVWRIMKHHDDIIFCDSTPNMIKIFNDCIIVLKFKRHIQKESFSLLFDSVLSHGLYKSELKAYIEEKYCVEIPQTVFNAELIQSVNNIKNHLIY